MYGCAEIPQDPQACLARAELWKSLENSLVRRREPETQSTASTRPLARLPACCQIATPKPPGLGFRIQFTAGFRVHAARAAGVLAPQIPVYPPRSGLAFVTTVTLHVTALATLAPNKPLMTRLPVLPLPKLQPKLHLRVVGAKARAQAQQTSQLAAVQSKIIYYPARYRLD